MKKPLIAALMCVSLMPQNLVAEQKKKPPATPTFSAPYDFRGIQLGITLSTFRALAPLPRSTLNELKPACSSDNLIYLPTPEGTREMGGEKCAWVYFDTNSPLRTWKQANIILIPGVAPDSYSFDFIKLPKDTEARLYRITIPFDNKGFDAIADGLRERFGMPDELREERVSNSVGGVFSNWVQVWKNNSGRIELRERFNKVDQSLLTYELTEHSRVADKVSVTPARL